MKNINLKQDRDSAADPCVGVNALVIPTRVQRMRRKGWKMPPNTVYVGRPTKWGNPYQIKKPASKLDAYSRINAIESYKIHLQRNPRIVEQAKSELKGKNLACWCKLDQECHADILLKIANEV